MNKVSGLLDGKKKADPFAGKPHLKKAFKEFDRLLQPLLDRESKKLNFAVSKVEAKLERCEKTMLKYCDDCSNRALADLDDAYENSTEFQGYTPSNDISVYGALSDMGADDLEHAFQRALVDMYQFHVIRRERF